MERSVVQAVRGVLLAAAAYTAAMLVRYYISHGPRFAVESAFFIFVGIGVLAVLLRRADPERAGQHGGLQIVAMAAAFVAGAFVIYAPALQIGLLSDDFVIAGWAERLELVHFEATGFVRPGVPAFWWMLQKLPGDFAATAHAANVVLHGVNAALVSRLAVRLGLRRGEAVAAGAIYAIFPGLSEAVVWLSGVQDVLMTTFALAAVVLATADRPRVIAAVVASIAALLVKETAIVIPGLAALVMLGRDGIGLDRRRRTALVWLTGVSAVYVLARLTAGLPSSFLEVGDWRYFVKQLVANSYATVGAPWTDDWGRTHAGLALMRAVSILGLAAAAFFQWRRNDGSFRAAAACAAWVVMGTVPAFSLFYVGPQLEGARYVYLAAAGFAILLAQLMGLAANRVSVSARPIAVGLMTGLLTVPFLPAIRSDVRRWQAAAAARQDVLTRAADQAARAGCTTFAAEGEADSIAGAYVFRHGLAEALALPDAAAAVPCRVVMESGEVVVSRAEK